MYAAYNQEGLGHKAPSPQVINVDYKRRVQRNTSLMILQVAF